MIPEEIKKDVDRIVSIIEWEFKIPPNSIHEKTRVRETLIPRQFAHTLVRLKYFNNTRLYNLSLAQIGMLIGGKDHATVLHSCKTINNIIEVDKHYKKVYDWLLIAIAKNKRNLLKKEINERLEF